MLGPVAVVGHRNTSARSIDSSSALNEITAVLPPARTIFRRRSFTESSLMAPMRVHPVTSVGSVVRRTLAIAAISFSAQAGATAARRATTQRVGVFNGDNSRRSTDCYSGSI